MLSRRLLPLNAMRAFEAAAKHCHLRRAAEELGVTHGAVSRHVRQLEEQLDVELFDRSHNRLTLTSAGERFLQGVSRGLDSLAESALYLDPESMQGPLTVASTPSIGAGWLVRLLGEFNQKYPEIELHLRNIDPHQREVSSDIDVAVCYGKPSVDQRAVSLLLTERYIPVCHPSLLSAGKPVKQPADVLGYPLLHDRHQLWPAWLSQWQVEGEAVRQMYFQDSFQVIMGVRSGHGIGLIDRTDIFEDLQTGQLVALLGEAVEADASVYLMTDKPARITVRAQLFADYVRDQVQQWQSIEMR